jgi:hypothetical protein
MAGDIRGGLARYARFQTSAQILEDLLLVSLDFEQDWLRHAGVVLPRMGLARLQEDVASKTCPSSVP